MRRTVQLAVGGVVGTAALIAGCGGPTAGRPAASNTAGGCAAGDPTITAHGTGVADEAPDLLTLSLGVTTSSSNAGAALADNNSRAQAVEAQLRRSGVAAADLQTSGLTINPVYSNTRVPYLTGYQVNDTLVAKLRRRAGSPSWVGAGAAIDAAAAAAGDAIQIQSLSFSLEQDGGLASLARGNAVRQAASQAMAMATAANVRLGRLCSISDTAQVAQAVYAQDLASSTAGSAGLGAVPLQAGTEQESAQVTAVYAAPA